MGGQEELEVTILSRDDITTYPRLREAVKVRVITYLAPGMPARTVRIPVEEWSPEREAQEIARDIKAYREFRPEVKRIPMV